MKNEARFAVQKLSSGALDADTVSDDEYPNFGAFMMSLPRPEQRQFRPRRYRDTPIGRLVDRTLPEVCTIYFIGPDDGPIKIGMTSDLDQRLATIRACSPLPLKVWATISDKPAVERAYHKRFAQHRLHGEWFDRHPDILAEIATLSGASQ